MSASRGEVVKQYDGGYTIKLWGKRFRAVKGKTRIGIYDTLRHAAQAVRRHREGSN
jgi:hypothetical protein